MGRNISLAVGLFIYKIGSQLVCERRSELVVVRVAAPSIVHLKVVAIASHWVWINRFNVFVGHRIGRHQSSGCEMSSVRFFIACVGAWTVGDDFIHYEADVSLHFIANIVWQFDELMTARICCSSIPIFILRITFPNSASNRIKQRRKRSKSNYFHQLWFQRKYFEKFKWQKCRR